MLRRAKGLAGYSVCATDGVVGTVRQYFFDRDAWTVRYLETQATECCEGRPVLLSPVAVRGIDDGKRLVLLDHKRAKVEESPRYAPGKPVSRHYEVIYHSHYGWPVYWGSTSRWGGELRPSSFFTAAPFNEPLPGESSPESFLLSTGALDGLRVFAQDREIGTVEDIIFDDVTWSIRFLEADAGTLVPGKHVLIAPPWVSTVSVPGQMLLADLPPGMVRNAPSFDRSRPLTRDDELRLFAYYGRGYEIDEVFVGRATVR